MTQTPDVDQAAREAALGEPTKNVNWKFLVSITLANIGVMIVAMTPLQNLLARYSELMAGAENKITALMWLTAFGSVASMVFNPLSGALSDRTTSRFGRRRPWIVGSALVTAVLMYVMSMQTTLVGLGIVWFLALAGVNSAFSPLTAYVPDQVPVRQRGMVSGLVGISTVLGIVVGVFFVALVVPDLRMGTWVIGVVMLLFLIPIAFAVPDAPLPKSAVPAFNWGKFFSGFWISPRKYPDFAWAFITRFLVWVGTALVMTYLFYYLQDELHYAEPLTGQAALIGLYGLGLLMTAIVGGRISDRLNKRKIFVMISSVVMGVSVLILAIFPSFIAACIGAWLLGLGYGVYLAVDQALITQVLPAATDRARDLGVINIANTAPQILAPFLGGPIVLALGYSGLFITTCVVMVLAGILVNFIKSVP